MTYYIGREKVRKGNATYVSKYFLCLNQATFLAATQVNLRYIPRNHCLSAKADAGKKHLHLFRGGILRFVQDDKALVQRTPAHVSQRRNFNGATLKHFVDGIIASQIIQCIVEWAQIGIHLL